MHTMTHKGYAAHYEYSENDSCFIGHIAGIRDVIGFHAASVMDLRNAFIEAVNDYLDTCAKLQREPNQPTFGDVMTIQGDVTI